MAGKRRVFGPAFNAKVALAAAKGDRAMPARTAAPLPRFPASLSDAIGRSRCTRAISSAVPSVEPSSTTITSTGPGSAATFATTQARDATSLKAGITTE